jgi:hypothetical protein
MKNYALGLALGTLFLLSWLGQWMTTDEGVIHFWNATFENWQSEFLQLFCMVVLTKYLIFKGSPQSRDGDDEMQAMLRRLIEKGR